MDRGPAPSTAMGNETSSSSKELDPSAAAASTTTTPAVAAAAGISGAPAGGGGKSALPFQGGGGKGSGKKPLKRNKNASATGAPGAGSTINNNRRKRRLSQPKPLRRLSSSSSNHPLAAAAAAKKPTLQIHDDAADRHVNPLLSLPVTSPAAASALGIPHASTTSTMDLWPLLDVWFDRPDTYSIRYKAALLGLVVSKEQECVSVPMQAGEWQRAKDEEDEASVLERPAAGSFVHTWKAAKDNHHDDDEGILEDRDPLYVALLRPTGPTRLYAVTGPQQARLEWDEEEGWQSDLEGLAATTLLLLQTQTQDLVLEPLADKRGWCLLSAKKKNKQVARMYCQYEWYPVQPAQAAELVLSLDKICFETDDTAAEVLGPEQVVWVLYLTAAALEQARARHVWYAIWNHVPNSWVSLLEEYFRMKVAPRVATVPTPIKPAVAPVEQGEGAPLEDGEGVPVEEGEGNPQETLKEEAPPNEGDVDVEASTSELEATASDTPAMAPTTARGDDDDKGAAQPAMDDAAVQADQTKEPTREEHKTVAETSNTTLASTVDKMETTNELDVEEEEEDEEKSTEWDEQADVDQASPPNASSETLVPTTPAEGELFSDQEVGPLAAEPTAEEKGRVRMVCDINKCSYKYAFLKYKEDQQGGPPETKPPASQAQRWLVRIPSQLDTTVVIPKENPVLPPTSLTPPKAGPAAPPGTPPAQRKATSVCSAPTAARQVTVHVRATLAGEPTHTEASDDKSVHVARLTESGTEEEMELPLDATPADQVAQLDILRHFVLPSPPVQEESEILKVLIAKQEELVKLEDGMEPKIRSLLGKVIEERAEYESPEAIRRRTEEEQILADHAEMLQRRKDADRVNQERLEQDMDAVCDICNDGEVTPDNQILFCEACNVAVHQMCYGVERIPEGDYYCLACRYLGRDKVDSGRDADEPKLTVAAPLPISCELCPLRHGAFIRTEMKKPSASHAFGKWVHAVCAKWQGLHFVDPERPDLIEDVTELKDSFRQLQAKCALCQGDRGAMNPCRSTDCKKWIHVSCARAAANCEVIHGENVRGPVEDHPWTLKCPDHSPIKPDQIPKDATPIEQLIEAAKQFPPEPKLPPAPLKAKPFNTATGDERVRLLADPKYERALLYELTMKKFAGVRCHMCDQNDEGARDFSRCISCGVVCCGGCRLDADGMEGNSPRCPGCSYFDTKRKVGLGEDEIVTPQCAICYQVNGFLRPAFARPMGKKTYWTQNPKEYRKTMFQGPLWAHGVCTFWNPTLSLQVDCGKVDCSQVVLSHGRAFVKNDTKCFLCGQSGGLKPKCDQEGCRFATDDKSPTCFHATCAREAGLELATEDDEALDRTYFFLHCYRHGGNEFNLRARLEDLIEIEKRRAGEKLTKTNAPMTFAHASRILHAAISVMKMLGWAWRWAEWWVDYNSSWEPLLEPGQREEDMTKEQLKIVDSTRESRCHDARRCRLSAFGAALRNRCYDLDVAEEDQGQKEEFDRAALERALKAILRTQSLVGPLREFEIDFFVEWLTLAYYSKSSVLGFGEDKIPVANSGFCVHKVDGSPKYELGSRPLPGKLELNTGVWFEPPCGEVDDFLKTEVIEEDIRKSPRRPTLQSVETEVHPEKAAPTKGTPGRKRKAQQMEESALGPGRSAAVAALAPSAVKKRRGRPPLNRTPEAATPPVKKRPGRKPKNPGPVQEARANSDAPPKKRRGRPPKIKPPPPAESHKIRTAASWSLPLSSPGGLTNAHGRIPRAGSLTEPRQLRSRHGGDPPNSAPAAIPAGRKRRGRPPKNRVLLDIQEAGSATVTRTSDVGLPSNTSHSQDETIEPLVRKRRGRPPKKRTPEESTTKAPAIPRQSPRSSRANGEEPKTPGDGSVSLGQSPRSARAKRQEPIDLGDLSVSLGQGPRSARAKRQEPINMRGVSIGLGLEKGERVQIDYAASPGTKPAGINLQKDEEHEDEPYDPAEDAVMGLGHEKASPGRPRRSSRREVTPKKIAGNASKFDVVKRRRRQAVRLMDLTEEQVRSKSYSEPTEASDTLEGDDNDEDDMAIADLVGMRRKSLGLPDRQSVDVEDSAGATLDDDNDEETADTPQKRGRLLGKMAAAKMFV